MKIPMISGNTPAIRELYINKESIILCERADPKSLANRITSLKDNLKLRAKIVNEAYKIYIRNCTTDTIGRILIKTVNVLTKDFK